MNTSFSHRDAGVDIDAGDQLVEIIKPRPKVQCIPKYSEIRTAWRIGQNRQER